MELTWLGHTGGDPGTESGKGQVVCRRATGGEADAGTASAGVCMCIAQRPPLRMPVVRWTDRHPTGPAVRMPRVRRTDTRPAGPAMRMPAGKRTGRSPAGLWTGPQVRLSMEPHADVIASGCWLTLHEAWSFLNLVFSADCPPCTHPELVAGCYKDGWIVQDTWKVATETECQESRRLDLFPLFT